MTGEPAPSNSPPAQPADRGRRGRLVGRLMMGAGVLVLLFVAWVSFRAYQAYSHLQSAAREVSEIQGQISGLELLSGVSANTAPALAVAARLHADAASAADAVDDPAYRLAKGIPLIGPNLATVADLAHTVAQLGDGVVTPMLELASTLNPSSMTPKNGAVDLTPLIRATPPVIAAQNVLADASRRMAGENRARLVGPVLNAVQTLQDKLGKITPTVDSAARALRLMPPMMGGQGPRRYLVVFQNLAEPRATGGIFGSYAVVEVDRGRVRIADQGYASRTIGTFPAPVVRLGAAVTGLYSPLMAIYPQDVNFTPDFPTAAGLFAAMYTSKFAKPVDGVLAVDPVALSYLLVGAAPIDIGSGLTVTSDSITKVLLADVYARFPDVSALAARDALLARATALVFTRMISGGVAPGTVVNGLARAAGERRVLLWSTRPAEQHDLEATQLGGQIPRLDDPAAPLLGIFLNDGTGAKLGYYLRRSITVTPAGCRADGRRELQVRLDLDYAAPATGLPSYVLGEGAAAAPLYQLRTNVQFVAPVGGTVLAVSAGGKALPLLSGFDNGRSVGIATVQQKPGTSTVVQATMLTGPPAGRPAVATVAPRLLLTPGAASTPVDVRSYPACVPVGG